jgi:hypothetical protein
MTNSALRTLLSLCIAAAVSGCAMNPVVPWTPPARTGQPATNLDYAEAYAQKLQEAYKQEISRQAGMSIDLGNGLVAMGALALALAAGNAHRDAVAGLALIGGTAYGLGNMNLNKQRLLILQAGNDAIGCARRAVIPLRMAADERRAIEGALLALDRQGPGLLAATALGRAELAAYLKAGGDSTDEAAVRASAALANATDVTNAVTAASRSGRVLVTQSRQAGDHLVAAVDKIDAAVIRASVAALPDLTSVPRIIAGLAGFAAQIAPGAGVDKIISAGLAKRAAETPKSGRQKPGKPPVGALENATGELEKAVAAAQGPLAILQSYLFAYAGGTAALEAMKDCGVTDVMFPLKTSAEKLVFATGVDATKGFMISGGTRPYVVELTDSPIAGLSIKGPPPFEARTQVSLSKEVTKPQTVMLLVMDSASPMNTVEVQIVIGEAAPTDKKGATPKEPTLQELADALKEFTFTLKNTSVTPGTGPEVKADSVVVGVKCVPKPGAPYPQAEMRDKLLETIAPDNSFAALAPKLKILPSGDCVKEK